MPIHNEAFSAAVLAKTLLGGLDDSKAQTTIATPTLKLLLCALIEGQMTGHAVQDSAGKALAERMAAFGGGNASR